MASFEIVFMLLLTGVGLVAFVKEVFPLEVPALGIVAIGSYFVLSHALTKTGLLESIAHWVGVAVAHSQPWCSSSCWQL